MHLTLSKKKTGKIFNKLKMFFVHREWVYHSKHTKN